MKNKQTFAAQPISVDVLNEKYLKNGETTVDQLYARVSKALASAEKPALRKKYEKLFLANMHNGAIGAGRIMSAAGTEIQATLINCFVQPVGDCIKDFDDEGFPGIYEALREAAETMRRGGGVGYDFSRIRPNGAYVKGTHSSASGPCSYMDVFDKSCTTVESAGARRGAQMGVLRIDHPDVMDFITAKRTPGRWNNFNVSVAVTSAFMEAVEKGTEWNLVHKKAPNEKFLAENGSFQLPNDGGWVYKVVKARDLWDTIMKSTYDFAEPGILFMDNINGDNNLSYTETIAATNPCGEQPLPPYGCCDLGPINLTKFVRYPFGPEDIAETLQRAYFDFPAFEKAVALQVRALDNVLDVTFWPLPQQRQESEAKRRIGVGFTGLGNTLSMLRLKYNSTEGREMAVEIAETMRNAAYMASVDLAQEKGTFPLFNATGYLKEGTFASRLPKHIKAAIRKYGIRNSHLLSIAPTGTVSLAFCDNASNGIEPPFSWTYTRKKREGDGTTTEYQVEDHAYRLYRQMCGDIDVSKLPEYFVSALEMSAQDHLAMMIEVQPYIDTAISKTVNIPADYPFESFKNLYFDAWKGNLKGLATYRPNDTLGSVLSITPEVMAAADNVVSISANASIGAAFDPMKMVIEKRPKGSLTAVSEKIEYWTHEGKKRMYLLVSFLPVPKPEGGFIDRAIEFFMPVGQTGESQQWMTASMRLLSLAARGGFLDRALRDMRKVAWDRGPVRLGTHTKEDGTQVPMWHDSEVAAMAYAVQQILEKHNQAKADSLEPIEPTIDPTQTLPTMSGKKCPECGAHALIKVDGCHKCTSCGFLGACG